MTTDMMIEKLNDNGYNADKSGWYIFVTLPYGNDRQITKSEIIEVLGGEISESQITTSEDGLRIR